ncbi:phosphatidylserine/phosphatidylglycerophosphate/cardiolipin synthase family protein [Methylacidimicrobium sp. B4]|uniref:phospholipase D-like domain-containing protein n=1 Tax=Methylacidimicrobium sp. B4 TaxID=2796139 RepID=UPI001A8F0DEF|nr:phospholipase D-like domain-containing protein [Methylacidimicrobium sp. B4]QSR85421.1 cardiolipin synthase B [Methylacidimicrobium sp. B4]
MIPSLCGMGATHRRRHDGWAGLGLFLLVLAGCAGVPRIPLGEDPPGDPLPRQGAAGGGAVPETVGNRVLLLAKGPEWLETLFAAMEGARDHINLEFYILENLSVRGRSLEDLLTGKLRSGVAVNLILDGYGSHKTDHALLERLREEGARVLIFHPVSGGAILRIDALNERDHRKILVVDGKVGFVGGINLYPVYQNHAEPGAVQRRDFHHVLWNDLVARIEGPAVADLQRLFFATWSSQKGPPVEPKAYFPQIAPVGAERVRVMGSGPKGSRALFYTALLEEIHAARRRVDLCTGSFVPAPQLVEELVRAARRGVAVRLVLPSALYHPVIEIAGSADYGELLRAGVRIWEMPGEVLHAKLARIDGAWTAVGSSNLDERSIRFNQEVDAIVRGRKTASAAGAILEDEISRCREITLRDWRRRAFLERVGELFASFWRVLL